ncbi:MAG TPA: hypothetical protein VLI40_04085 [Gemmatimonadaceae bacterium]|nr:hypothetical protein [Gemmatimonadaceae bacterium]
MTLSARSTALLKALPGTLLVICASACASSGTAHMSDDRTRIADVNQTVVDVNLHHVASAGDRDVGVTVVQAFDALPAAYIKLGIKSAAVLDTTGGVYTVGARNLRLHGTLGGTHLSSYIDCGSGTMAPPADTYDIIFSASTYITARTGGSTLHTLVEASAKDPMASSPRVRCTSTGRFERELATLVDSVKM